MTHDIDLELVLHAQRGDKKAFELLVLKYQRRITRAIYRVIRDYTEVEDVTQEVFIKAYRGLLSFRAESSFYTWLYRIALNTAKNHLLEHGRQIQYNIDFCDEESDLSEALSELSDERTPETELSSQQTVSTINKTIASLPEDLRTAITLREMDGLSYEGIALIMDCPVGTVRSRIFRAREAIAIRLKPLLEKTQKDNQW